VDDYRQLLARSDAELASVDPLVMNLLVARSIPSLADLDVPATSVSPTSGPKTCADGCPERKGSSGRRQNTGRTT
jgi:hypothetical protein